jgi:putative ABC transport system permease protein
MRLSTNRVFSFLHVLALAVLMLGLAALLASVIPARRAAGFEPMVALRNG